MTNRNAKYDDASFKKAERIGWQHYSAIYAKYIIASGKTLNFVHTDATQTTKMVLWYHTLFKGRT